MKFGVISMVDEVVDALPEDVLPGELDVGGDVFGDVLDLAFAVDNEQKALQHFKEERPVQLVGENGRARRRHLALLDGIGGLGCALLLLDATDLVDGFLEDCALVRLHRQRAHVREVG